MKKILFSALCLISLHTYAQKNKMSVATPSIASKIVLTPGQVINTVSSANIETAMNMGMPMNIKNDMTMKSTLTVTGETAEDYMVTLKLTGMKMSVEAPGQNMSFDSDKAEDAGSEIGQQIGGKLNTPIEFLLSKKTGKGVAKNPDTDPAESNPFSMGTDPTQILADLVFPLPPTAQAGYQWQDSLMVGNLKTVNNYKLISIDKTIGVVDLTSSVQGTKDVNIQGSPTTMTMSTQSTAKITFNAATGLVIKKELSSNSDASMDLMGNNIPMTITVTSTVENQ